MRTKVTVFIRQCLKAALIASIVFSTAFSQQTFEDYQMEQNRELDQFKSDQEEAFAKYVEDVTRKWNVFKNSTKKDWYEYSGDLNTVSKVDFEKGEITVETIVPKDSKNITEQAQNNIAEQIKKLVSLDSITGQNILEGQLELQPDQKVDKSNVSSFVEKKVLPKLKVEEETIKSKDGIERVKITATFKMVPNHLRIRAEQYLPTVRKYSSQYNLEVPLVMALIQTESYFNPRAKSSAPAYGLMQLVPKSGGREAYRYVFNKDKIVSSRYLYSPENNIQLGCAYLAKLRDNEFKDVIDKDNKRYCIIASYNTGPGNLSRAITGKRNVNSAVGKINQMESTRLYSKLKRDLPYAETRDYLVKVETRRQNYLEWQ